MFGFGGELREAVPLWQSLLVAALVLAGWAAAVLLAWRALVPKADGEVLASGRASDAMGAGACSLLGAVLLIVPLWMVGFVAFGYTKAHEDPLSWGEAVAWTVVGGSLLVGVSFALALMAAAAWRGSRGAGVTGLVLLGLVLLGAMNAA